MPVDIIVSPTLALSLVAEDRHVQEYPETGTATIPARVVDILCLEPPGYLASDSLAAVHPTTQIVPEMHVSGICPA
jgi:hypothetical protein